MAEGACRKDGTGIKNDKLTWIKEDCNAKTDGSYALISAGNKGTGDQEIAMQYFEDRFMTYPYADQGDYMFNFYRVEE